MHDEYQQSLSLIMLLSLTQNMQRKKNIFSVGFILAFSTLLHNHPSTDQKKTPSLFVVHVKSIKCFSVAPNRINIQVQHTKENCIFFIEKTNNRSQSSYLFKV